MQRMGGAWQVDFFTKVREAVKGANMGEKDEWVELWEKFWEGERRNWIKEPERQAPFEDETAEAADIGDFLGTMMRCVPCGTHRRGKKHQIAPV